VRDPITEWARRRGQEVIKHDPEDFGGRQFTGITDEEVQQRLCVAKGCGERAITQSGVMDAATPGELRIFVMCRGHLLATTLATLSVLGDPNAIHHVNALAEQLDYSLLELARLSMPVVVPPKDFRCADCGGGQMAAETQGMFRGKRWIHTCGLTINEATKLSPDLINTLGGGTVTTSGPAPRLHTWACKLDTDHEGACEPDGIEDEDEPVRTAYEKPVEP